MTRYRPGGDELDQLLRDIRNLGGRLERLERPDSSQRNQVVERLQEAVDTLGRLVNELSKEVDGLVEEKTYLRSEIDNRIKNPPSGVAATGNVSATGTVSANGDVSAGGDLRGSNLYATSAPGFNITGGRVAGWLETSTGRLGTASSSRRYKQDEAPAEIDPAAVLSLEPKTFRYREEVARAELDPDYVPAVEVGLMAEDVADAGLEQFVVFRDGEPDGIHYAMLPVALLSAIRAIDRRLASLESSRSRMVRSR